MASERELRLPRAIKSFFAGLFIFSFALWAPATLFSRVHRPITLLDVVVAASLVLTMSLFAAVFEFFRERTGPEIRYAQMREQERLEKRLASRD